MPTHFTKLIFATVISAATLPAANITMTTCFSSAPVASASFNTYAANAIVGIQNGCVAEGTPGTPGYYQSLTAFSAGQIIYSADYNSFDGVVNPPPPYNNEMGNQLLDGLLINGNGSTFSLSELNFSYSSNDIADALGFTDSFSDPATAAENVYSPTTVGVIFNGSNPPTYITSGPATQVVNELIYVGVGNAFCTNVTPGDCGVPGATESIPQVISYITSPATVPVMPFTVSNTYSLDDANGNVIVSEMETAVLAPEPAMAGLTGLFLFAGLTLRRFRGFKA